MFLENERRGKKGRGKRRLRLDGIVKKVEKRMCSRSCLVSKEGREVETNWANQASLDLKPWEKKNDHLQPGGETSSLVGLKEKAHVSQLRIHDQQPLEARV